MSECQAWVPEVLPTLGMRNVGSRCRVGPRGPETRRRFRRETGTRDPETPPRETGTLVRLDTGVQPYEIRVGVLESCPDRDL